MCFGWVSGAASRWCRKGDMHNPHEDNVRRNTTTMYWQAALMQPFQGNICMLAPALSRHM